MSFQAVSSYQIDRNEVYYANDIDEPDELLTSLLNCHGYKCFSASNLCPSSLQLDEAKCECVNLASLQFLSLSLNVDNIPGYNSGNSIADPEAEASSFYVRLGRLKQIISKAFNLQEITINFQTEGYFYEQYPAQFHDIFPSTGCEYLTALQLSNICCDTNIFTQFLVRHHKTIREIRLEEMAFYGGSMRCVFSVLTGLHLQVAELTGIWKELPQMNIIVFYNSIRACTCVKRGSCLSTCTCLAGDKCLDSPKCLKMDTELGDLFESHIIAGFDPSVEYPNPWPKEFVP